jgi:hypothetical protein
VRLLRDPAQLSGALYAVSREAEDHFDCSVRDAAGDVVLEVQGYTTTPLPEPVPDAVRQGLTAVLPS